MLKAITLGVVTTRGEANTRVHACRGG